MIRTVICGIVLICISNVYGQFPPQGGNQFPPQGGPQGNNQFPPGLGPFPGPGPQGQPGFGQGFPGGFPNNGGNNVVLSSDPWEYATCYFNDSGSTTIGGRVDFRQLRSGGPTYIRVQVEGLPPSLMSDTEHGIHIHEYGDIGKGCYAAGRHFDADGFSFHGSPNNLGAGNSHDGDLGNLRQTNNGDIDALLNIPTISLTGDFGIVGRAVVLKEGRDDLGRGQNAMSLQTGNAGAPIACCTIALSDRTNWYRPYRETSTFSTNAINPNVNGGFNNPVNPQFNNGPVFNQNGPNPNRFNPNGPGPNPNQFNPNGPGPNPNQFNPNGFPPNQGFAGNNFGGFTG